MDYRNKTWNEISKSRGAINMTMGAVQTLANRQRVQNWCLIALGVLWVALALHVFGAL